MEIPPTHIASILAMDTEKAIALLGAVGIYRAPQEVTDRLQIGESQIMLQGPPVFPVDPKQPWISGVSFEKEGPVITRLILMRMLQNTFVAGMEYAMRLGGVEPDTIATVLKKALAESDALYNQVQATTVAQSEELRAGAAGTEVTIKVTV
jgi:hypothetical protein